MLEGLLFKLQRQNWNIYEEGKIIFIYELVLIYIFIKNYELIKFKEVLLFFFVNFSKKFRTDLFLKISINVYFIYFKIYCTSQWVIKEKAKHINVNKSWKLVTQFFKIFLPCK